MAKRKRRRSPMPQGVRDMGPTAEGGKWSDVFGGVPPESMAGTVPPSTPTPPPVAPVAGPGKSGKWGKIAKGAGKFWWALPFALEGAGYVKDAVKKGFGVGEKFFDGKSALDEFLGQKRQEQAYDDHQRKRAEALQQLKMQNRMRMMQVAPHLAQSLLAGRELPEDAVVIGGRPRVDLLDQVAEGMSNGAFQQGM